MRTVKRFFRLSFSIGLVLATHCLSAQQGPAPGIRDPFDRPDAPGKPVYDFRGATLLLNVFNDSHAALNHQAVVKLTNKQNGAVLWQPTENHAQAVFRGVPPGSYEAEVSAAGYLSASRELNIGTALTTYSLDVTITRDPTSMDFDEIPTGSELPVKAQKRVIRALDEFRLGRFADAQKDLTAANKMAPASAEVNFFSGYLAFEQNNLPQAQMSLTRAVEIRQNYIQAIVLLGEIHLRQREYGDASAMLERAVSGDDQYSLPHRLLAQAYLQQHQFAKAREQAKLALDKSRGADLNAGIVLGEALANLGDRAGAEQAFKNFLQQSPANPLAVQVQNLLTQVERAESKPELSASEKLDTGDSAIPDSLLSEKEANANAWQPPGVDQVKPQVVQNVTCPEQQVLEEAGVRVTRFVDDLSQFAAVEEILHEQLNDSGHPVVKVRRDFNYVASISEIRPGFITVDEDRIQRSDTGAFPEGMATRGLPALALIFHPEIRGDYDMTCEGLGDWSGQATWLVHFRQRDDRPKRIKGYQIGENLYPVGLKGRAWISADTYQIVRMESELIKPVPEIRLRSDHQIVEYGAVTFEKKNTTLWLPKTAELYFDFRRHHYYRRHSFDHFMLFAVDSHDQAVNPPKSGDGPVADQNSALHN